MQELIDAIATAGVDDLEDMKEGVRALDIDAVQREQLVSAWRARHETLTGVKLPITAVRDTLNPRVAVSGTGMGLSAQSDWADNWVFISTLNRFFDLETGDMLSAAAFDQVNGSLTPINPRTMTRAKPSKYVADAGSVEVVAAPAYLPHIPDRICTINRRRVINTFDPSTLPVAAEDYTDEGEDYIDSVEAHIEMVVGAEQAHILTQWLAFQVQQTGRKILWAPLIQSIEGVGKSFFGYLLRAALGVHNVGTVSPSQLSNPFNAWATNVSVNILEELKIAGHNRFEAVNALKPLITDDFVQINAKGIAQFVAPNTTNYIAFTNYRDALPVSATDRRWWVIQSPIESLEDIPDHKKYFPALFEGLTTHAAEVVLWLQNYEITDEFLNMKQAPQTAAKMRMIETEDANMEGLAEAKDVIEEGTLFVSKEILSSRELFKVVEINHRLELGTRQKNAILKKLGYQVSEFRPKVGTLKYQIWTLKYVAPEVLSVWCQNEAAKGHDIHGPGGSVGPFHGPDKKLLN